MDQLLTIQQAAEILQVSDKHIRRLCWGHELRHNRVGRGNRQIVRIPREALTEFLARTEVRPR